MWQGLTGAEVSATWPAEYAAWRRGEGIPVGGEDPAAVGARASAVVRQHLPPSGDLLLVTHGGTARALVGTLLALEPSTWWRLSPLGNTCWATLVEFERGWRLERHNSGLGPLLGTPTGARRRDG